MAIKSKTAAPAARDANALVWATPGPAVATLYLQEADTFTAIYVSLMPGRSVEHAVSALIGDSITYDDFMNINGFEDVFRLQTSGPFITVAFINRSQASKTFELVFVFSDDARTEQRYAYTLDANSSHIDYIDVRLVNF